MRLRRRGACSVIVGRSVLRAPDGEPQAPAVELELFDAVRVLDPRLGRQHQLIGQQLGGEPVAMWLEPLDQTRVAAHRRRDPIADLVTGRLAEALEPMPDFPRGALRLQLRREGRVECDEQLAFLRQLVSPTRTGEEADRAACPNATIRRARSTADSRASSRRSPPTLGKSARWTESGARSSTAATRFSQIASARCGTNGASRRVRVASTS